MRECGQATLEALGVAAALAALLGLTAALAPAPTHALARAALCDRAALCGATSRPPAATSARRAALVRELIAGDLVAFERYRASPARDPALNFSTDLCSAPLVGSTGRSFDFTRACVRHDFGYRNTKALGSFAVDKPGIDRRFLADMRAACAAGRRALRERCRRWALVFYVAVRELG